MKRLTVAAAVLLAASAYAKSDLQKISFYSENLQKEIKAEVYLPSGYAESDEKYPVVYMLHGASHNEEVWRERGAITYTADALIQRKKLRPSIIVMPTLGEHSWYANGNEAKAETAFIEDVIPYIEKNFKALTDRKDRSVAGLSMGGYGALNLSLTYPDKFCAAGIISPAIYDPFPPETSASRKAPQLMKDGQFDEQTWTNLLYTSRMNAYIEASQRVPMYIATGDHDKFNIVTAAAKLFWKLHELQPDDVEYRVIDGDHDWLVFRELSVPALEYINAKCLEQ